MMGADGLRVSVCNLHVHLEHLLTGSHSPNHAVKAVFNTIQRIWLTRATAWVEYVLHASMVLVLLLYWLF